jgi:hypothetical protein
MEYDGRFAPEIAEEVADAIERLNSACAIPFGEMTLGLEEPQTFGFALHPLGGLQVCVAASGPDVFLLMATNGLPMADSFMFVRDEIPNDASGFTLATVAVDCAFRLCLQGMLGTGDWPTTDAFLSAMKPEDGPPIEIEDAWVRTDEAALTYLGQIDINPPILRKLILTAEVQDLFDQYFRVRPNPEFEGAYEQYLQSAKEAPDYVRAEGNTEEHAPEQNPS